MQLHTDPVPHYRWSDIEDALPPAELHDLAVYMRGQTTVGLPDGGTGIYKWDYDRWEESGRPVEQGEDWD